MSYHFYVPATKDISYQDILDKLENKSIAIAWQEEFDLSEKATSARFYTWGASSRGIGLHLENDQYDVSINILSSREDNVIALDLAITLSQLLQADITPEDSDAVSMQEFKERFNTEWLEWHKMAGTGSIHHFVNDPERGGTISIGGCLRTHYIGKKLLSRLQHDQPSEETLYNRLIDNMREIQFLDEDEYRIPSRFVVAEKDNEPKWEYVVVSPENNFFLPKIEYVILFAGKENHVKIPYEQIHQIADYHFRLVDEEQYFVEYMEEKDFLALMEKARNLQGGTRVKPAESKAVEEKPAKKGWKFWK